MIVQSVVCPCHIYNIHIDRVIHGHGEIMNNHWTIMWITCAYEHIILLYRYSEQNWLWSRKLRCPRLFPHGSCIIYIIEKYPIIKPCSIKIIRRISFNDGYCSFHKICTMNLIVNYQTRNWLSISDWCIMYKHKITTMLK